MLRMRLREFVVSYFVAGSDNFRVGFVIREIS